MEPVYIYILKKVFLSHANISLTHFQSSLPRPSVGPFPPQQALIRTPVVSEHLCPLMPPADTYSPLQLCGSISHPTHAVMVTLV